MGTQRRADRRIFDVLDDIFGIDCLGGGHTHGWAVCGWRNTKTRSIGRSRVILPQPSPRPAAVFRDELHPDRLEGRADGDDACRAGVRMPGSKSMMVELATSALSASALVGKAAAIPLTPGERREAAIAELSQALHGGLPTVAFMVSPWGDAVRPRSTVSASSPLTVPFPRGSIRPARRGRSNDVARHL